MRAAPFARDDQGARAELRNEHGASAVEFAIIISLLFVVLFGTIQFGIAYNRYQGLQAAAREGARVAAVGGSEDEIRTRVQQSQSLFNPNHVQIRIDYSIDNGVTWPGHQTVCDDASGGSRCNQPVKPCVSAGVGNLLRVTATVPNTQTQYAITIPLWGSANVNYRSSGVFRCEQTG